MINQIDTPTSIREKRKNENEIIIIPAMEIFLINPLSAIRPDIGLLTSIIKAFGSMSKPDSISE